MTVDALTLSKIDEAWNEFPSDISDQDSMVGTITLRNQFKNVEESYSWIIILQEASETVYIIFMGMNTKFKVDSHFFNAYHFIHLSL